MSDFVLSCESTADYPRSFFEERQIAWVPFHYNLDGVSYPDDLYASISPEAFFDKIKAGAQPTTSQVGVGDYVELWEPFLKEGKDVPAPHALVGHLGHVQLRLRGGRAAAPGLSRADRARDRLLGGRRQATACSWSTSPTCAMAAWALPRLGDWAEEHKLNVNHWFFVSDLDCLKRGGRRLCHERASGQRAQDLPRAQRGLRGQAHSAAEDPYHQEGDRRARAHDGGARRGRARLQRHKCVLSQSNCRADADAVVAGIEEKFPQLAGKIEVNHIGTVIGSHTGPGTVALFFMGDRRVD